MALIDDKSHYNPGSSQDNGVQQLWSMVLDLSEQLSHNRVRANALYSIAANAKLQAVHSKTGFVLRRLVPKHLTVLNLERTWE
jgi:hypothetical protein